MNFDRMRKRICKGSCLAVELLRKERKADMKKCAVCEAEIGSELEEFGDLREPVCASCWLSGRVPGLIEEEVEDCEEREKELRALIQDAEEEIWDLQRLINDYEEELRNIEKKLKKVVS